MGEVLEPHLAAALVPDAFDGPREVGDLLGAEDLACARSPTQARRQVERAAPVSIANTDRLTRIEADADRERQLGHSERFSTNLRWRSVAARIASRAEVNTHNASSPRSSRRVPPRDS